MSTKKKTKREEISAKVSECLLISIDGVTYFGELVKKEGVVEINNAIEAKETLSDTVSAWIKADNVEGLESLEVSGNSTTLVTKKLTEDQKEEVELVIINAARAFVNAVPNLINKSF